MYPQVGQPRGSSAGGSPMVTIAVAEPVTGAKGTGGVAETVTRLVTIVFLQLSSALIVNEHVQVWRDTRVPPSTPPQGGEIGLPSISSVGGEGVLSPVMLIVSVMLTFVRSCSLTCNVIVKVIFFGNSDTCMEVGEAVFSR